MAEPQPVSDPTWDSLVKSASSMTAESSEISRQLGESAKLKSGIAKSILESRPPPAPEIQPPPPPPGAPPPADTLKSFGGVATILGIIGGAFTREPLTASLNAASAAMEGYRQADLQAYKANFETWQKQSDYMRSIAEWQQGQYHAALEQHKGNIDQLTSVMNAIAARDQDLIMQHTLRSGDLRNVMQLMNDRENAIMRHKEFDLRVQEFAKNKTAELEALDEMKKTDEYRNAQPAQRQKMLSQLHGEFQKDANVFAGGEQSPSQGASGQEYLKTLPPDIALQVKALAEGRLAFPSGFALRSPYWQKMLQAVSQYDPGFDAVNYNARSKTRADFTSGQAAKNITSFNTVMGHLDSLEKAWSALDNTWSPDLNSINTLMRQREGDGRIKSFNLARNAVADELERAFRGTGGNVTEIEQWKQSLDINSSPEQQKAVIKQGLELLKSRIDALGDQYNRGMGVTSDPLNLLNPKAKSAYERLTGEGAQSKKYAVGDIIEKGGKKYRITGGDPNDPDVEEVK